MKVIGITGKSGSGKTTLASLLAQKLNCRHIDVDKIAYEALYKPEVLNILQERFGSEIVDENGNLDRIKMGDIVFTQRDIMKELTNLTLNYMQQQLDSVISQDDETIVIEWVLLPYTKYWKLCNSKILISSDDEERKSRVISRDNISAKSFDKRDFASVNYSEIQFDYIFENDYQAQTINSMLNTFLNREIEEEER